MARTARERTRPAKAIRKHPGRRTSTEVYSGSDLTGHNRVLGFVLALIAFGGAIVLTVLGAPEVGALFLSAPVMALIFAFVVRR